ncbi:hypothetical protein [Azohydromonas lata]|uniref:Uncharacterized protein n=1 Tax=Azohydromonas lata TaxID=45677 RepID=A0ABU5IS06_9BURK|nr:hypothetical protein [Azohydromonas lata]MDZ5461681.1 hypothetical protein [Azohydromonas lata]
MSLARGHCVGKGWPSHVVSYRHVVRALRRKSLALLNLVYRK